MWDIVHLVGFTIEIYYDARSYKRKNSEIQLFGNQAKRFKIMVVVNFSASQP